MSSKEVSRIKLPLLHMEQGGVKTYRALELELTLLLLLLLPMTRQEKRT